MEAKELKVSRIEVEAQLEQFIGNIKVEGLSPKAKLSLVKLKIALSKIKEENDEFRKNTISSIDKPEGYDELETSINDGKASEEDKATFEKLKEEYNKKFISIAEPYFNEIVTIPFELLEESDFEELVSHNDVNMIYGYEYIYNKLVKK